MKKILLTATAFAALATQQAKAQSIGEKLVGNWTVTQIAIDLNGNNQLDKEEQENVNNLGFFLTLNKDGSGTGRMDLLSSRDDRFVWETGNNGTEVTFIGRGNPDKKLLFYKVADGRQMLHVDKISGNNLQLSSSEGGMTWLTLKKK